MRVIVIGMLVCVALSGGCGGLSTTNPNRNYSTGYGDSFSSYNSSTGSFPSRSSTGALPGRGAGIPTGKSASVPANLTAGLATVPRSWQVAQAHPWGGWREVALISDSVLLMRHQWGFSLFDLGSSKPWPVEDGPTHGAPVTAWAAWGGQVWLGSETGEVTLWSRGPQGWQRRVQLALRQPIVGLAASEKLLIAATSGFIVLLAPRASDKWEEEGRVPVHDTSRLIWQPPRLFLLASGALQAWDLSRPQRPKEVTRITAPKGIRTMRLEAGSLWLAADEGLYEFRGAEPGAFQRGRFLPVKGGVRDWAFTPHSDGSRLWVLSGQGMELHRPAERTFERLTTPASVSGWGRWAQRLLARGTELLAWEANGRLERWDTTQPDSRPRPSLPFYAQRLMAAGPEVWGVSRSGSARLWTAQPTWSSVGEVKLPAAPRRWAATAEGVWVALGEAGAVRLEGKGSPRLAESWNEAPVLDVAVRNADVAFACGEQGVCWRVGGEWKQWQEQGVEVQAVAWAKDGLWLAEQRQVRLLPLADGAQPLSVALPQSVNQPRLFALPGDTVLLIAATTSWRVARDQETLRLAGQERLPADWRPLTLASGVLWGTNGKGLMGVIPTDRRAQPVEIPLPVSVRDAAPLPNGLGVLTEEGYLQLVGN